MIECGYMEERKCNTCAECMSCPENNKVERYQKEDMTTEEAVMYIQSIPNKIWEQLDECEREAMEMAFKSLEKQIPKKVIIRGLGQRYCPTCRIGGANDLYCGKCGQKLSI